MFGAGRMPTPQEFQGNWLFPDRTWAPFTDSTFPDNARIAQQASAIDFDKFICFSTTISFIILYP